MATTKIEKHAARPYAPFLDLLEEFGIGKTKGFELKKTGLIETFKIGAKNYAYRDSFLTLPQRLAQAQAKAGRS